MSYRHAKAAVSKKASLLRHRVACGAAALSGAAAALLLFLFFGWQVISPAIVILLCAAAIGLAIVSTAGTPNTGEVYFPRSDGLWVSVDGGNTVDARFMAGLPPAVELSKGFQGGLAAATVLGVECSGRRSAGKEMLCVTLLVTAPGWQRYRTRVLMHRVQGDEARLRPGQVILAGRFSMGEPDIALLSRRDLEELSVGDRALATATLAAARVSQAVPRLPLRDSRAFRLINFGYNDFWTFWYERPSAIYTDVKNRGDWSRHLLIAGFFLGSFVGTVMLVLTVIALQLLVPVFDSSGPGLQPPSVPRQKFVA